ncbi:MAG: CRTAC1 family protein, partial [Planctomycetota bacterium]|nr:CRTAC1 family protein [Planctomycetota bacterium]
DGKLDIYLTTGTANLGRDVGPDGPRNRLYRQEANGRFSDVTASSGLGDAGYGMGVAVGDIDNDGDADVYVTNFGPDRLYRNRGDGTFEDITATSGIAVPGWSCSAAFLDYDCDGFLDLFVTQYVKYEDSKRCVDRAGRPDYCGPESFRPSSDVLLHNNGDGTFTDVSARSGITSESAAGLGVVCDDLNSDGLPDVYVANDAYANHLWINQGNGTFRESALLLGAAYNAHGKAEAGMGVVAADLDGNDSTDLYVTHLANESNTMYRNTKAQGGFIDGTGLAGLAASSMSYTGFGTAAFDVELDGDLDLLVVNGRVARGNPLPGATVPPPWDVFAEPNLFYMNNGNGRFELLGTPMASVCDPIEISRALVAGDIDSDGDIDVLINNIQGSARLYRNDAPRKGHWLGVRATSPQLRRDAIGAKITVFCGERRFSRTINRGHGYLSSHDPRAHFGVGGHTRVERIDVRWPDGLLERFPGSPVDRYVELVQGTGEPER